ncbi:MAG: hypothetical protein KDI15_05255 [Thiothrix sp.]|nr:hypothetical protein [Thiothrix sp.]HPE61765.1 aspartate/glutamate racemase family protein [Thiolinea sp.]
MLNTQFPRLLGDIGNPASFGGHCEILRLTRGRVGNIVSATGVDDAVVAEIINAAGTLEQRGVSLITTSCGFLAPLQARIRTALRVPFLASALNLLPLLYVLYGPQARIGILTFDSRKLGSLHLQADWHDGLCIAGVEQGCELYRVISQDETELDPVRAEQDVLAAARTLLPRQPVCLLLECTNLSPYRQRLREQLGLPVYDLMDAVHWILNASTPAAQGTLSE